MLTAAPGAAVQTGPLTGSQAAFLGLSGYQWVVIAAGWAGWGFDVYDAVLFNFVARNCIPVVFGAFTFYLPELFPVRIRATGAGFCYNTGRVLAALGPLLIGWVTAAAGGSAAALMQVLLWLGAVPLAAALLSRFLVVETRGRTLPA